MQTHPGSAPNIPPAGTAREDYFHERSRFFIGKQITFDDAQGIRRPGVIIKAEFTGYTHKGQIPDWSITVQGKSGATMTVSLVESKTLLQ